VAKSAHATDLLRVAHPFASTVNQLEIFLVKNSFRRVAPIADQAAALFYARLFDLDPSLRPLFRGDLVEQGRKLMHLIGIAVGTLDEFNVILPTLRRLGARQAASGVREDHYATIGAALLWTLEKGLGPSFTPEVKAAWSTSYATVANAMIEGSRQSELTPSTR